MNELAGKESQIQAQLSKLKRTVQDLRDTVSRTEERLSSVLRIQPATDCITDEKQHALVPLADAICSYTDDIETQAARLQDILSRLEL